MGTFKLLSTFFLLTLVFLVGNTNEALGQIPTSGLQVHLRGDYFGNTNFSPNTKINGWPNESGSGVFGPDQSDVNKQPKYTYVNEHHAVLFLNTSDSYATPKSLQFSQTAYAMGIQNSEIEVFVVAQTQARASTTTRSDQFIYSLGENFTELQFKRENGVRSIPKFGQFVDNPTVIDDTGFHLFNTINTDSEGRLGLDGSYV